MSGREREPITVIGPTLRAAHARMVGMPGRASIDAWRRYSALVAALLAYSRLGDRLAVRQVAERAGVSERNARRALKELEQAGVITREHRRGHPHEAAWIRFPAPDVAENDRAPSDRSETGRAGGRRPVREHAVRPVDRGPHPVETLPEEAAALKAAAADSGGLVQAAAPPAENGGAAATEEDDDDWRERAPDAELAVWASLPDNWTRTTAGVKLRRRLRDRYGDEEAARRMAEAIAS